MDPEDILSSLLDSLNEDLEQAIYSLKSPSLSLEDIRRIQGIVYALERTLFLIKELQKED